MQLQVWMEQKPGMCLAPHGPGLPTPALEHCLIRMSHPTVP
uniref:Uncharacterized protein n=1 Tax=Anguilla anguilla TaxID=7936 RepID=A0A0E9U0H5_ANGAN